MQSHTVRIGENEPYVGIEVAGYVHPDVAEPEGMDLLDCLVHACAPPVNRRSSRSRFASTNCAP